jgi:hypothetical protein
MLGRPVASGPRKRFRFSLVAVIVVGLAAACGSSGKKQAAPTTAASTTSTIPATTTSSVPTGYTGFTDTADQFSVAVPTSWNQVDPSSPDAASALQRIVAANPKLQAAFGSGTASFVQAGTKFLAIDATATGDFAPNLNIIAKSNAGLSDADLPQLLPDLRTEFAKIGATITSTGTITLAGHQAMQLKLRFPINQLSGGKTIVDETQDYVAANDYLYILTFAGSSAQFSVIQSTFSIIGS